MNTKVSYEEEHIIIYTIQTSLIRNKKRTWIIKTKLLKQSVKQNKYVEKINKKDKGNEKKRIKIKGKWNKK